MSPKFEEVESLLDEGETYRTAVLYQGHDPVPDARLGTWQKRIRSASSGKRNSASTDIGKAFRDSIQPLTEVFTAMGEFYAAIDTARYGPPPEPGTGGDGQTGNTRPQTPLDRIKDDLSELATMKNIMKDLGLVNDYDPNNPKYPPIAFNGSLPAWMHPTALTFSKEFIKDVLGSLGETAQEFGFRFRKGLNGEAPKTAPTAQPQPQAAAPQGGEIKKMLESENAEEVAYMKKFGDLTKNKPVEKPIVTKAKDKEKEKEKAPEIVTIAPTVESVPETGTK